MPESVIKTKRDGAVATVTIDRAAEGNMLTVEMLAELSGEIRGLAAGDAKVMVLRSTGAVFCRGRDVRNARPVPTALAVRDTVVTPILDVYDALTTTPLPVIAAVQGPALGFGCALATACDITVASSAAAFQLPEMEKNLPPTLAISAMMTSVPKKALTELVYSMRTIDADTALGLGIVSRVVAPDELDRTVDELAAAMATRSREALVAVKDYFRSALGMERRGAADFAGNLLATVLASAKG